MIYTDDYTKASEYLRLVLAFLGQHQLPASPINYQVGYEYCSGRNQPLIHAIDDILRDHNKITEAQLLDCYTRYVNPDEKALSSVREELNHIIHHIKNNYQVSHGELSEYLGSLNDFAEILSDTSHAGAIVNEVQGVIDRTRSTEDSQRSLDAQMVGMMEEVETLRRQLEQVREESLNDSLTGLANRKAVDQRLEQLMNGESTEFSVAIGDIDYFKKFNDSYGHLVGDKVLRYVGQTIKSCVKGKDLAARFGGEEFLLVLPDTRLKGAGIVADQIRIEVCKKTLTAGGKESYGKVTLSLGVAEFNAGESAEDLIQRADQALYRAKENGRNRVEHAE